MEEIPPERAQAAIEAAVRKSKELGVRMDIAIVDSGANLKAFARMDGAWLGSIAIAIKKAKTARFFDMRTGAIGKLSQPGGSLYNIEHCNGGLITFPGAFPSRTRRAKLPVASAFPVAPLRTTISLRQRGLPLSNI